MSDRASGEAELGALRSTVFSVARAAPLRPHAFLIVVLAALITFAGGRGDADVEIQSRARPQEFITVVGAISHGPAALLTPRWERETELSKAKRSSYETVVPDGAALTGRNLSWSPSSASAVEVAAHPDRRGGILRRGPPLPLA